MTQIVKYANQVSMALSNSPYSSWDGVEKLTSLDYNYASCNLTKKGGSNSIPAPLRFSNFGFNIPETATINKVTVSYELHKSSNKVKLFKPSITLKGGSAEVPITSSEEIKNKYTTYTEVFKEGGTTLNNLTITDINDTVKNSDFGVLLSFPENTSSSSGYIYIDSLSITIDYSTTTNYIISNGETKPDFPSQTNPKEVEVGSTFNYVVYFRSPSGSYTKNEKVTLILPDGVEIVNSTGNGTFTNNVWSPVLSGSEVTSLSLIIQMKTRGIKSLQATSNVTGHTTPFYVYGFTRKPNALVNNDVNFSLPDVHQRHRNLRCNVLIESTARTDRAYTFGSDCASFPWTLSDIILLEGCQNIKNITKVNDTTIDVEVENPEDGYKANIGVGFRVKDNPGTHNITVTCVDTGTVYTEEFQVLVEEPIIIKFNSEDYYWLTNSSQYAKVGDTSYVDGDYTLLWATHEDDFYVDDSDLSFMIEEPYGYIGPIKLTRGHSNASNDVTNTLIKEQYQNRVNYGKQGNYTEARGGELRIPPQDMTVLRGLVKLDKPIPVDTVPTLPDGDSLNFRGWAELYGVKSIKKVNEFLQKCTPQLEFLTEEICTRFLVTRGPQVEGYKFSSVYTPMLEALDQMSNYFLVSGTGTFYSKVIKEPNYSTDDVYTDYGNYSTLDKGETIVLTSKNAISNTTSMDLDWLNWLTTDSNLEHENWKMAIRLLDSTTGNIAMEYLYYDFRHRNTDGDIVNKAFVRVITRKNGEYKVLGYKNLYLDWGNTSSAEDIIIKLDTTLCNVTLKDDGTTYVSDCTTGTLSTPIVFTKLGDYLQMKLNTNISGVGEILSNREIRFKLTNPNTNQSKTYTVNTDKFGIAKLQINLANGLYTCEPSFVGDEYFNECKLDKFSFETNVAKEKTRIEGFNYNSGTATNCKPIITTLGSYIVAYLYNSQGVGIPGEFVDFTMVRTSDGATKTYPIKTDSTGKAALQINLYSGNYKAYLNYMGSTVYQPSTQQTYTIIVKLSSDAGVTTSLQGSNEVFNVWKKKHMVTLLGSNGEALVNKKIVFTLTWDRDSSIKQYGLDTEVPIFTDANGQAGLEINLNDGVYHINAKFNGDTQVSPALLPSEITNDVIVNTNGIINTNIVTDYDGVRTYTSTSESIGGTIFEYPNGTDPVTLSGATVVLTLRYKNQETFGKATVSYDTTSDSSGKFNIPMRLANGDYVCRAVYGGGPVHDGTYSEWEFKMDCKTDKEGQLINRPVASLSSGTSEGTAISVTGRMNYTVTLKDADGVPIQGEDILFTLWDVDSTYVPTIKSPYMNYPNANQPIEKTNSSGQTSIPINLTGSMRHVLIQATYAGSDAVGGTSCKNHLLVHTVNSGGTIIDPVTPVDPENPTEEETPIKTLTGTKLTVFSNPTPYTDNTTLIKVKLTTSTGTAISGKNVEFVFIDANNTIRQTSPYSHTTQSNGVIEQLIELDNGSYTLVATFKGDNDYAGCKSTDTAAINFTVNKPVTKTSTHFNGYSANGTLTTDFVFNNKSGSAVDGTIKVRLLTDNGVALTNKPVGWKFTDGVNSVYYGCTKKFYENGASDEFSVITNGNTFGTDQYGYSKYDIQLNPGTYTVFVKFPGNTNYELCIQKLTLTVKSSASNSLLGSGESGTYADGTPKRYFNNVELGQYGLVYGSSWHMDLEDGVLNIRDYGLTSDNGLNTPKILINNAELDSSSYRLQIEIQHPDNKSMTNLPQLNSQLWCNIYEDVENSPYISMYNNIIISPSPVPNRACHFVRKTSEGLLYYYDWQSIGDIDYVGTPYNQYKAGCDLQTVDGYSVLNTEEGYNPISICNGLIKVTFHRLSKFIEIARYNPTHKVYVNVRTLRISEVGNIKLESFNDDKVVLKFGYTTWTMWRGHPFVQVEHSESDLKFVNGVDTVWCEMQYNDHLGSPTQTNTSNGYFDTYFSPNYFLYSYHLNDDFELTNFKLYASSSTTNLDVITNNGKNNREELLVILDANEDYAEVFFPYPVLMEKPSQTFTLLIDFVDADYDCSVDVILNGYTKDGRIQSTTDPDPSNHNGYKDSQTIQLTPSTTRIKATFTIPTSKYDEIKYIDFNLRFHNGANKNLISLTHFMLAEGDGTGLVYTANNPGKFYDKTKIYFEDNYYAKLYNKKDKYGLCVIRPNMDEFYLGRITKSTKTVLAPYFKSSQKWDSPELVAIEYMTFSEQTIDINQVK